MSHPPSEPFRELAEQFDHWRRTRTHRRAPQPLKEQTVALLEQHPMGLICEALNLSYGVLSRWRRELCPDSHDAPAFVPLPAGEPSVRSVSLSTTEPTTLDLELSYRGCDGSVTSIKAQLPFEQWRVVRQWLEERS